MPTTQIVRGVLMGVVAVALTPLTVNGDPIPEENTCWIDGTNEVPIQWIIEAGERVVDRADGVGVVAVHEEDDTLIGADLEIVGARLNLNALLRAVGGTVRVDGSEAVTGWDAPTITEQRDNPKRFRLDVYALAINEAAGPRGFARHTFYYCTGMPRDLSHKTFEFAKPGIRVKARPHPGTGKAHGVDFVEVVPEH